MIPLLHMGRTSECFGDKGLIMKRYINSSVYFLIYVCLIEAATRSNFLF